MLARAARDLPRGHVVYCLTRDKRRDGAEAAHDALTARIGAVVHSAAKSRMAIGRDDMLD